MVGTEVGIQSLARQSKLVRSYNGTDTYLYVWFFAFFVHQRRMREV